MTSEAPHIVVENISFQYPESTAGISNVSITVNSGDRVLLLGQNGSGKSTLLSLIAGKRKFSNGTIHVKGRDAFDDTRLNHVVSLIGPPWPPEAYFANTVDGVTTPNPDTAHRNLVAKELHLPLKAPIDKMSSGEKRRVQILFGLMHPADVLLLDECSTDIDVVERATVLGRCRRECEEKGRCCVYATHILDGVGEWATHVALMEHGRLTRFMKMSELTEESLVTYAHRWMSKAEVIEFCAPTNAEEVAIAAASAETREAIIIGENVNYRHILANCNIKIYRGSRTLMIGCNGSGKTTLLNIMGSKTFYANKNKELTVAGIPVFQDMSLNKVSVLCGDWWVQTPGGEVHVKEMVPVPLSPRAQKLQQVLAIDLNWDVRCVSAGELKRIQLFLRLHDEREVVFMDEATADLDVDQRHMLLRYLYEESVERGVTVVYSTHIFEGLGGWATDCIVMDRSKKGVHSTSKAPILVDDIINTLAQLKAAEVWEL